MLRILVCFSQFSKLVLLRLSFRIDKSASPRVGRQMCFFLVVISLHFLSDNAEASHQKCGAGADLTELRSWPGPGSGIYRTGQWI